MPAKASFFSLSIARARATPLRLSSRLPGRRPTSVPCPAETRGAGAVGCWGEADATLAELGRLDEELSRLEEKRQQELRRVEEGAELAARRLEARRAALMAGLERFCRRHQPALAQVKGHGRRSRRLLFGRVGYRTSEAVTVAREPAALRALARWRGGRRFLRQRAELNREALRRFLHSSRRHDRTPAWARLRRAGIRLERRQSWFYEVDPQALQRWAS